MITVDIESSNEIKQVDHFDETLSHIAALFKHKYTKDELEDIKRYIERREQESTLKIAKKLLEMGMSVETVIKATGLNENDIQAMKNT